MKLVRCALGFAVMLVLNVSSGALGQTQYEMNQEACGKYKKADAELNQMYRQILREYAEDKNFVRKMKTAQRAWVTFKDAHLASIYPDPDPRAYGSVNPMCRCLELEWLTSERIKMLRVWTEGVQEGDVCSGSRKVKK